MKFLALKIYIGILEIIGFLLITSSLIAIGWVLLGGEHPLSGESMVQAAIVAAVVSGVLFAGLVIVAFAQLLEVVICIENNTARTAENTARILDNTSRGGETTPVGGPTQLMEHLFSGKAWRLTAASLAGIVIAVILFDALLPARNQKALADDKPPESQGRTDPYTPESIAQYCRARPTSFYGAPGTGSGVSCRDWVRRNPTMVAKWTEVKAAEERLFGGRSAEVDNLGVISEGLQDTTIISTRCMAHFCPNHSAMWTVDLSTGKSAGEITSDGVIDKSGKAETVVFLGDYDSPDALPIPLQESIREDAAENPGISVRYIPQIQ